MPPVAKLEMDIHEATRRYERWLASHMTLVAADLELKHAHMAALGRKGNAAKAARKDASADELLAACAFDTLESIEAYLTAMARAAIERATRSQGASRPRSVPKL